MERKERKEFHLFLGQLQRRQIAEIIKTGRFKTGAEIAREGIRRVWKEVMEECA